MGSCTASPAEMPAKTIAPVIVTIIAIKAVANRILLWSLVISWMSPFWQEGACGPTHVNHGQLTVTGQRMAPISPVGSILGKPLTVYPKYVRNQYTLALNLKQGDASQ